MTRREFTNVSLPKSLVEAIQKETSDLYVNVTDFVREAVRLRLAEIIELNVKRGQLTD